MSKIVILGDGFSGHTVVAHLRRKLGKEHEVLVVFPNRNYQWVPSNIWVGIGRMKSNQLIFLLEPLYKRNGIGYKQAKVVSFRPEGNKNESKPCVSVEYVFGEKQGTQENETYDYLINSTGPKLAFDMTEDINLGINKAFSICTYDHVEHAGQGLKELIVQLKTSYKKAKNIFAPRIAFVPPRSILNFTVFYFFLFKY
jgi:sulfide:quinone oxidoreductase